MWEKTMRKDAEIRTISLYFCVFNGARRGIVDLGNTLQTERSQNRFPMGLLEFFIDLILPAVLWSWSRLSL